MRFHAELWLPRLPVRDQRFTDRLHASIRVAIASFYGSGAGRSAPYWDDYRIGGLWAGAHGVWDDDVLTVPWLEALREVIRVRDLASYFMATCLYVRGVAYMDGGVGAAPVCDLRDGLVYDCLEGLGIRRGYLITLDMARESDDGHPQR
jgi:hypothetical protein